MVRFSTIQWLVLGLCVVLIGFQGWLRLNEALWNDEIYTLQQFVLKGLPTVLTDYHVPNNHVLSNIFHWLWLKLTGVSAIGPLLDNAFKIRLLPAVFSLVTLVFVFRAGRQLQGIPGGLAAVLILSSTLGFGHFAFQVRGYALSMMLMAILLDQSLRTYAEGRIHLQRGIILAALVAALLYTIPSNLYPVLALGGSLAGVLVMRSKQAALSVAAAWAGGAALSLLWYFPVLGQVFNNTYIEAGAPFRGVHIDNAMLFFRQAGGLKWLALPMLLWSAWKAQSDVRQRMIWFLLSGALFLPFVLSAIRGDEPPPRAWSVLLPVLALWLANGWQYAVSSINKWPLAWSVAGVLICVVSFFRSYDDAKHQIEQGMVNVVLLQGLNYGYYQQYYDPNAEYNLFKQKYPNETLVIESAEEHDMPVYLEYKQIKHLPLDSIYNYMETHQTMYVSTRYPKNFIKNMEKMKGGWRCSYLQPSIRYPRVIVCQR